MADYTAFMLFPDMKFKTNFSTEILTKTNPEVEILLLASGLNVGEVSSAATAMKSTHAFRKYVFLAIGDRLKLTNTNNDTLIGNLLKLTGADLYDLEELCVDDLKLAAVCSARTIVNKLHRFGLYCDDEELREGECEGLKYRYRF